MDVGIWFLMVAIMLETLTPAQAPVDYYILASNYIFQWQLFFLSLCYVMQSQIEYCCSEHL